MTRTISFGARLTEMAGFEAVYMTGNGVSASLLGRADVAELTGAALGSRRLMTGSASATLQVLESGVGDIVVKLVDRRADGEVRLLREAIVVVAGAALAAWVVSQIPALRAWIQRSGATRCDCQK
jgi:hypothetical protein